MGVWADLFLSGWASQTGLTNDLTDLAAAGGISDSLMRPQGFCAYRDRGTRRRVVWCAWRYREEEGKQKKNEQKIKKSDKQSSVEEKRQSTAKEGTKQER